MQLELVQCDSDGSRRSLCSNSHIILSIPNQGRENVDPVQTTGDGLAQCSFVGQQIFLQRNESHEFSTSLLRFGMAAFNEREPSQHGDGELFPMTI